MNIVTEITKNPTTEKCMFRERGRFIQRLIINHDKFNLESDNLSMQLQLMHKKMRENNEKRWYFWDNGNLTDDLIKIQLHKRPLFALPSA